MRKRSKRFKKLQEDLKKKDFKNLEQVVNELKNGSGVKFGKGLLISPPITKDEHITNVSKDFFMNRFYDYRILY